MQADRPYVGVLLMLGFCVLAPLGDSIAKLLGERMAMVQLLTFRFVIQAAILLPLAWLTGRQLRLPGKVLWLTAVRTVLHIIGVGAMFLSLRYLPIADAIAIAFVMPLIMLILGKTVLNETVGPHRLVGCAIGFIGTMLVVQPNFADVGPPALLPLVVAVVFALFMLVTRQIAKYSDPISLQAVSGAIACAILVPAWWLGEGWGLFGFDFDAPVGADVYLLAMLGILGTMAHLLMTWSLRFAPSATLAPMQYLEIPIATFFGWLIFRDIPNGLAAVGIGITVAAGLYIIHRERLNALAMREQQPSTPPVAG